MSHLIMEISANLVLFELWLFYNNRRRTAKINFLCLCSLKKTSLLEVKALAEGVKRREAVRSKV